MTAARFRVAEVFTVTGLDGAFVAGEIIDGNVERGMRLHITHVGMFRVKGVGGVRTDERIVDLALQLIFVDDKHRSRELFEPAVTPGLILELEAAQTGSTLVM